MPLLFFTPMYSIEPLFICIDMIVSTHNKKIIQKSLRHSIVSLFKCRNVYSASAKTQYAEVRSQLHTHIGL